MFKEIQEELELKWYPHFDKFLPPEEIKNIVTNPERVAKNAFYPFLEHIQKWKRFGREPKTRKIRCASRRDSYIYAYYRKMLSKRYELWLANYGIQDCPTAYRRIPVSAGLKSNKCNIHFAKDAFIEILNRGSCFAITLDISQFFESIDHNKLYKLWCDLLELEELPPDHKAIFKSLTNYSVVNRDECYERLGYRGNVIINGVSKKGLLSPRKDIPMQLCSTDDFRRKICGVDKKFESLIKKNKDNFGIPQGAPLSDLLANIYLIHFDCAMAALAKEVGGYYRRYSDDILFVCPYDKSILNFAIQSIKSQIKNAGDKLFIKDEKTNITEFYFKNNQLTYRPYESLKENSMKPMEYLGFSFDGQRALIKNGTISGYNRSMTYGIRCEANNLVARYPNKSPDEILGLVNFSMLAQKYGKIEKFESSLMEYDQWNFWTYARKSSEIMAEIDGGIAHQLRNRNKKLKLLLKQEIQSAYEKKYLR